MILTRRQLTEMIREILTEDDYDDSEYETVPFYTESLKWMSPPRDFYEKTGINMIHTYKLPPEFSSPEALQDYILKEEPEDPEAATKFYGDIVNALTQLNPELSQLKGIGVPDEYGLLPGQQLSEVYHWHLRDIVFGVASEMPPADIKYYLEGPDPTETERILQQFTDQTGVRPQWVISSETASSVIDLRDESADWEWREDPADEDPDPRAQVAWEMEYERGYVDGLYGEPFPSSTPSDDYAAGYEDGKVRREREQQEQSDASE